MDCHCWKLLDFTYNTTKFKLPLLEIVGVTPTNKTFSMAYNFISCEQNKNYRWVLERVKQVIDERYYPRVIVTDRDLALVRAVEGEFPNAHHLLCRWHINQNIHKYCTPRCSGDEYEHIKGSWDWIIKALTQRYTRLQWRLVDKPGT